MWSALHADIRISVAYSSRCKPQHKCYAFNFTLRCLFQCRFFLNLLPQENPCSFITLHTHCSFLSTSVIWDVCVNQVIVDRQRWELSSQWRHNGHDGVSNYQLLDRFLNCLFRRRSQMTGEFPSQRASYAENVSILMTSSCHRSMKCHFVITSPIPWMLLVLLCDI